MTLPELAAVNAPWTPAEPASRPAVAQLAGHVRLEWYEAVAVAHGLCHTILHSGDSVGPATLTSSAVWVTAAGCVEVDVSGPRNARAAIQRIGQILSDLLPPDGVPMGLSAVVWKAVDSPPQYASLSELSQALAYFERPNRTQLIQGVYERWLLCTPSKIELPSRTVASLDVQPAAAVPRRKRGIFLNKRVGIVAVSTAAVLVGSSVVARSAVGARLRFSSVVTIAGKTWHRLAGGLERSFPAAPSTAQTSTMEGESAGDTLRTAASTSARLNHVPARQSLTMSREAESIAQSNTAEPLADQASTADPLAMMVVRADSIPTDPGRVNSEEPANSTTQPPARMNASTPDPAGADDVDVIPPRPLAQQRFGPLPSTADGNDVVKIALVIREDGTVESVKAASRPRSISESLLLSIGLSAAKSWRFYPALRDGRPIAYRAVVSFSAH